MSSKVRKQFVAEAMRNWLALNEHISQFTKDEALFALETENEREEPRATFVRRLTQRYNSLAADEVRRELE